MATFGDTSRKRLHTCHPDIQDVLNEAIRYFDFTILEGKRSYEKQVEYFSKGASQTLHSKHLTQEDGYSHAVDIAPYPIDWNDTERFFYLAGLVMGIAESMGVKLTWGHDWDRDGDFEEHTLKDGPHFELYS